jgi:ABC-type sulfate/molybdate transport systems ATPase subunit
MIEQLAKRLDLSPLWNESARLISGGQARRVALARMLAGRPPLALQDEPFTALDRPAMHELIAALLEWHVALGFTLIAVDHRAEILEKLCTRAAVIESGSIVQEGSWPALAAAPATPLLARYWLANSGKFHLRTVGLQRPWSLKILDSGVMGVLYVTR